MSKFKLGEIVRCDGACGYPYNVGPDKGCRNTIAKIINISYYNTTIVRYSIACIASPVHVYLEDIQVSESKLKALTGLEKALYAEL